MTVTDTKDKKAWSAAKRMWAELRAEIPTLKAWEDLEGRTRLTVRRSVECGQAAGEKVMKHKILIESFFTSDSGGGFLWAAASDPDGVAVLNREFDRDVEYGYRHVALVELSVPTVEDRQAVTEYIDSVLLDLIETRQIGKIIKAHDRWGEHPYQRLIRETEQEQA